MTMMKNGNNRLNSIKRIFAKLIKPSHTDLVTLDHRRKFALTMLWISFMIFWNSIHALKSSFVQKGEI